MAVSDRTTPASATTQPSRKMTPAAVAMALGTVSLGLILGALGFQYIGHIPPCEMCHWQRWPHIAAIAVGLGGGFLAGRSTAGSRWAPAIAWTAVALVALAGGLGIYHAGVEWHWWPGPQACTGTAFRYTGGALDLNAPVVMCDIAAWRLFGLSLAGYNAVISVAAAAIGALLLRGRAS
jgi:disulfide bond formation protein DsbB